MIIAKPCACCQVVPPWSRWTDLCWLCAMTEGVIQLGEFVFGRPKRKPARYPGRD